MPSESTRRHLLFWPAAAAGLVLDLASKRLVFDWLGYDWTARAPGRVQTVIEGFFTLRTSLNTGTFFGQLADRNGFLVGFTVLMIAVVVAMFLLPPKELRSGRGAGLYVLALGLVLAGAAGNLWDRIFFGGVRDFLAFGVGGWHWPTFNLADAWLTVGIGAYLLAVLRAPEGRKDDAAGPAGDPTAETQRRGEQQEQECGK